METNQDEGVDVVEPNREADEKKKEKTGEIEEEAQLVEEPEEMKKVSEAPEEVTEEGATKEVTEEETQAEEPPEEGEVEEEEEEIPEIEKKEEAEEEIVEERIYTIPLQRAWVRPRKKRTPRAVRLVKAFIHRHMKPEALVMTNEVNEKLWSKSIQKPPRKIRVRAAKDKEGTVTLYLAEGD